MSHTFLIVEDNRNNIYLLEQLLADAGHQVWKATNGLEALDVLRVKGLPDIIVSDALMPQMDGFELCHALRRDPARCHVPFVIYTATFTERSDEQFATDVGADCYLIKPFDPEKLADRLVQVINQVRQSPRRRPNLLQDSQQFFEGHSRRISVKLEAKVDELSAANEALASTEAEIRELNHRLVETIRKLETEVEERRRTANELRLALSVAAMGSFGFDFDRGTSWWTTEALALLGAPAGASHLAWETLARRIPTDRRGAAAAVFAPDAQDPHPREVEFVLERANGEQQHLFARSERVRQDEFGDNRRIGVVRDITIRRTVESDRLKLERRLRQAQKMEAIGNLAGGIAHDFNNFLAVIAATSELLELDAAEANLPPRWTSGIRDIRDAANRARELVAQILLFSRNERAKREPIDLRAVIREAVTQLNSTMPAQVVIHTDFKTQELALANTNQMHQILLNLCTNAKHAIGQKPGEIVLTLSSLTFNAADAARRPPLVAGEYVRLDVSDNGCGMDEETVQRVFEPFFSTKPIGQGTGLGLSVVHGIMSSHEGAIFVESSPGNGTTFSLYLPLARLASAPAAKNLAVPNLPLGQGQRILVVDDEPAVAKVACSLIGRLGYQVEAMNDPQAARERLLQGPPEFDLVVTDYFMPGLTGADLARAIWARHPKLPMIMIVGFGGQMDAGRARAEGFKAFVSKPFTLQTLAESLSHALSS